MSTPKKPMLVRAMTVAGGIAILGASGAGLAATAGAATTSSASSTLAKIKYCESGGNYQAVNSSSGASGAYQFLNSTWRGLSASAGYSTAASAPASVQDAAALELYNQAGTSPWAASSGCWSKLTSVPTSSGSSSSSSSSTSSSSVTTTSASTTSASTASTGAQTSSHKASVTKAAAHKSKAPRAHARPQAQPHHAPQVQKLKACPPHGKHQAKPAAPRPLNKPANTFAHAA